MHLIFRHTSRAHKVVQSGSLEKCGELEYFLALSIDLSSALIHGGGFVHVGVSCFKPVIVR